MQIGFPGLLTLIFITLKLTDYIDWSWWWVLSPFWITLLIVLLLVTVMTASGATVKINRKSK